MKTIAMGRQPPPEVMEIVRTMQARPAAAAEKLKALAEQNPNQVDASLFYTVALRLQGKLNEAEQALDQMIERFPGYALAYQELGITLFAAGKLPEAVRALEKAIKLNSKQPRPWQVYADIMTQLGRDDVAKKARQQAEKLAITPPGEQRPAMDIERARDLLKLGDVQQAEVICRNLLAENPNDVETMCLLANVRLRMGGLTEAREILERSIEIAPDHLLSRVTLASTLELSFEYEEANKHLRIVDAARFDDPNVILLRSKIHFDYGQYDEAIAGYEHLLKRYEKIPTTLLDYGLALRAIGNRQNAVSAFREAERLEPGRGMPWYSLANLQDGELGDEDVRLIEGYLKAPGLRQEDKLLLSFALGKALEDKEDWDGAFEAYHNGNTTQRQIKPFQADIEHNRMIALGHHFDSELVHASEGSGCPAPDPIFVVGLPRTGSTLVEQILSSHSLVEGTFELPELHAITRPMWNYGVQGVPTNYCDSIRDMSDEALTAMGQDYMDRTKMRRTGNVHFVDKLLGNFLHIGLIKLILPNAKIIEVRKSPMAHCFSMWKQLFTSGADFSYDLKQLGNYYCDYTALMDHWHALFPEGLLSVSYDDLVTDTEVQVRTILEYCDLEFEEACLEPHRTKRVVRTMSSEQVRQPIYSSAIDHWRHFEHHLAPLKEALAPLSKQSELDGSITDQNQM